MRNILFFAIIFIALTARSISAQASDPGYIAHQDGDYQTAMREWRMLAEQGNISAQFNVASLYLRGEGVPKDGSEAIRWFRMAANQGDAQAQYNLELIYHLEDGVPQDLSQAFIWYSMAQINGIDHAQRNHTLVQELMDETQVSIAMQKAVDCLHSDYQNCE